MTHHPVSSLNCYAHGIWTPTGTWTAFQVLNYSANTLPLLAWHLMMHYIHLRSPDATSYILYQRDTGFLGKAASEQVKSLSCVITHIAGSFLRYMEAMICSSVTWRASAPRLKNQAHKSEALFIFEGTRNVEQARTLVPAHG